MSGFGPAVGNRGELVERLFDIAGEIDDFQNEYTERLSFEEYANLDEYSTKCRTLANLIGVNDPQAYIHEALQDAEDYAMFLTKRLRQDQE